MAVVPSIPQGHTSPTTGSPWTTTLRSSCCVVSLVTSNTMLHFFFLNFHMKSEHVEEVKAVYLIPTEL